MYQKLSVKLAHEGHRGLSKTKALLRSKVFFVGIDKMVENEIANCIPCQATSKQKTHVPLQPSKLPEKVWDTINIDYLGPLPNNKYMLVMIDQFSKYPVAAFTKSTSAKDLISVFNKAFSHFGYPETVISDNGPPFKSQALKEYMKRKSIIHHRVTPLWPQANGEVEQFMLPLTKIICTAHVENRDQQEEVLKFLMAYRVTPHSTMGIAPADIMYQREIKYTIPDIKSTPEPCINEKLKKRHQDVSDRAKEYTDEKRHAKDRKLSIGDRVLVRQKKVNKLSTPFNPHPYHVTDVKGTLVTAQNRVNHHQISRNITHFKSIPDTAPAPKQPIDIDEEEEEECHKVTRSDNFGNTRTNNPDETNQHRQHPVKEYPKRHRRPVSEWKKY